MARGKTLSVVFKANHQHQIMAFPPSLDELIAADPSIIYGSLLVAPYAKRPPHYL